MPIVLGTKSNITLFFSVLHPTQIAFIQGINMCCHPSHSHQQTGRGEQHGGDAFRMVITYDGGIDEGFAVIDCVMVMDHLTDIKARQRVSTKEIVVN